MSRSADHPTRVAAPAAGGVRLGRVAALGLASWGLGAGAHVAAGGAAPGWAVSVLLVLALGVVAVAVTARRRGLPSLVVVLGIEQVALHLVLARGTGAGCVTVAGHHDVSVVCAAGTGPMAMADSRMLVGHALATLVTAWLLARGEAWLWRTVRRLFVLPTRLDLLVDPETVAAQRIVVLTGRVTRRARPRGPPAYPLVLVCH